MKKFNIITLTFIVSIILIGYAFSQEPHKSSFSQRLGVKYHNQSYHLIYGHQIRFIVAHTFFGNWRHHWSLGQFCSNYIKNHNACHSLEDWRFTTLVKDERSILILGFYNLTGKNLAWVAVKNNYDGFYITSDQRSKWYPMEGYTLGREISFQWMSNGIKIKITVRDPNNVNGWTENDIWYKFSYY